MIAATANTSRLLPAAKYAEESLRLLVADDDPDIQDLLQLCLAREGFDVTVAGNGRCALDVFARWQPAIVLMDRQMPVMDGVEAARRMRESEAASGIPRASIVSISGSVQPSEEAHLRELGFDHFLPKPFRMAELLGLLERLVADGR